MPSLLKNKTFQIVTIVVLVFAILFGFAVQYLAKTIDFKDIKVGPESSSKEFVVKDVIDGDTIEVESSSEKFKVRYIGVDTPETVKPNTKVECYGKEASGFNKNLILNKKVKLESDVRDTDSFARKLRYVYLAEGEFKDQMVNLILVEKGYANALTVPPDVKYSDNFKNAERIARENNLGLWKECKS